MACRRLARHRRGSDGLDAAAESRRRRRREPPARRLHGAHAGRERRADARFAQMGGLARAGQRVRGYVAGGLERAAAAHQVGLYRRRESAEWSWENRLPLENDQWLISLTNLSHVRVSRSSLRHTPTL